MEQKSKVQQFIEKRAKLESSNVPNQAKSASIFNDPNPKIKSLKKVETLDPNEKIKLTPERFKKVQQKLKAGSSIKEKLNRAIKAKNADAADTIVQQVGEVAKKTGDTDLLKDLIKKVRKAGLTRKAGKKILSAVPFIGGALSALSSGDIKAAVPGLDAIDDLGPKKGSLDARIESGRLTPEDIKLLKKQNRL